MVRGSIIAMAAMSLVGAVWGGLGRMGLATATPPQMLMLLHGALIANGFFGTVISLERAVALDRPIFYAIPFACGLGSWLAYLGWPIAGSALVCASTVGLVGVFAWLVKREPAVHHVVMGLGAVAWAGAGVLLLLHAAGSGPPVADLAPWWATFLVLTIAGERLELARVLRLTPLRQTLFFVAVGAVLGGLAADLGGLASGRLFAGAGFVGLAIWLGVFDVARRTARRGGLTGYIGRTLLGGYVWLAVGGGLLVWYGAHSGGVIFDAQWHAIFIGFVLTMIFAHAPVVIRALAGRRIAYHPALYVAPVILHLSMGVRLWGDLTVSPYWRLVGGLGNAAAIVVFGVVAGVRLRGQNTNRN